jgi:hypothetical protein
MFIERKLDKGFSPFKFMKEEINANRKNICYDLEERAPNQKVIKLF